MKIKNIFLFIGILFLLGTLSITTAYAAENDNCSHYYKFSRNVYSYQEFDSSTHIKVITPFYVCLYCHASF